MKFFSNSEMDVTEVLPYANDADEAYLIDSILDIRLSGSSYDCKVRWMGFGPEEDSWEPIERLFEDVPLLLQNFLQSSTQRKALWNTLHTAQLAN